MSVATKAMMMGAHRRIQAYRDVGAILGFGGVAYATIPIGDKAHENAARTTVTTVGQGAGDGLVFTYSEAITAFDTIPFYRHNQLWLPEVSFNDTDEEADTPNAPFWSRDDAGGANGFSVGAWVNVTDTAATRIILSKWDGTTGSELREWRLLIRTNDILRFQFYDESANQATNRESDAAIIMGRLRFFVGTYDGAGGGSASDGATLYDNGGVLASTANNNGSYTGMENLATLPMLGTRIVSGGSPGEFFNGNMLGGPIGPFFTQQELTAAQVAKLYRIGLAAQQ